MEKRPAISVSQLFCLLFISRMVVSMTYGNILIGDSEIWDHLISAPISMILTWIILIPIYVLFVMDKKMNVLDNLRELCGRIGICIISIYILYFLLISFHTVSVFEKFIFNAINPPISVPFLTALLLFSSCYGAYKGIEAISRASGLIFVFTVFAMIFFLISLISSIEPINYKPLMFKGNESVFEGIKLLISQSSCVPAMAVLLPMAKGNHKKGIIIWNTGVYLVFASLIMLVVGTMGDFSQTQLFPVYTAAGIGKFGSFKHLDSLYLGIWISGIFIKLSLFLMLAGEGVKKIWGEQARKRSILIFGFLISVMSFFSDKLELLSSPFMTSFLIWFLIIISVIIPIVLIIIRLRKKKRGAV